MIAFYAFICYFYDLYYEEEIQNEVIKMREETNISSVLNLYYATVVVKIKTIFCILSISNSMWNGIHCNTLDMLQWGSALR